MSQKPFHGLLRRGAGKLRFPAPYVFNGLQPPKTAARPCTAEAVAFCDSVLCGKPAFTREYPRVYASDPLDLP
jgi:hypothetical protein